MSNNSYARTAAGMFDTINRRLTSVERRLPPPLYVPPVPVPTKGTTTERDAYFGVPATDPTRVALANQRVSFFNTDLGWIESYYAVTALSGLTALGLVTGTASGWYPVPGTGGPVLANYPTAQVVANGGSNMSGWSGSSWSRGGTAWIEYIGNGTVQVKKAGRYRVHWHTAMQTGTGELDMWLYAGTTFSNDAWELNATRFKVSSFEFANIAMVANDTCYPYVNAGSATVHTSTSTRRGEFMVQYLGPNLVTE